MRLNMQAIEIHRIGNDFIPRRAMYISLSSFPFTTATDQNLTTKTPIIFRYFAPTGVTASTRAVRSTYPLPLNTKLLQDEPSMPQNPKNKFVTLDA